jgi:hypothetical protein
MMNAKERAGINVAKSNREVIDANHEILGF